MTPFHLPRFVRPLHGSALVIVLAFLTLLTVLSLGFFLQIRTERSNEHLHRQLTPADLLADLAADAALAQLDRAIEKGRQFGPETYTFWASEPGRIHVVTVQQSDGSYTREAHPLYSAAATATNRVDLNRPAISGLHPITGSVAAQMHVGWQTILENPAEPASAINRANGRIAWWIDDESCKVNVNVADGSKKADLYRELGDDEKSGSYGFGTPTEISLGALLDAEGAPLDAPLAAAIAEEAWRRGFETLPELERISGLPAQFADLHRFHLTTLNRSPDETLYGEPKIVLMSTLVNGTRTPLLGKMHDYTENAIDPSVVAEHTGPIQFLYPTAAQLPRTSEDRLLPVHPVESPQWRINTNFRPANADFPFLKRIAAAIRGKRSDGKTFAWPRFPGTTGDFSDKYHPRQIDSLTLQIYDISHKVVFQDLQPEYNSSLPSMAYAGILHSATAPDALVTGLGRTFVATQIGVQATLSEGDAYNSLIIPSLQLDTRIELHFPAGFAGVPILGPLGNKHTYHSTGTGGYWGNGFHDQYQWGQWNMKHPLSGAPQNGFINPLDPWMGSRWGDQLLRVTHLPTGQHAGFDLSGQAEGHVDRDQAKAELHHPYATRNPDGLLEGLLAGENTLFRYISPLGWHTGLRDIARLPGVYLSQRNHYHSVVYSGQPTTPGLQRFLIEGGLQLINQTSDGSRFTIWDLVPLPSLVGAGYTSDDLATPEKIDHLQRAVIPIRLTVDFPGIAHYTAAVADPWVNKFPGDWIPDPSPPWGSGGNLWLGALQGGARQFYMRWRDPSRGLAGEADFSYFRKLIETLQPGLTIDAPQSFDGDNDEFSPAGGGDPLSLWLPRQDHRYPKSSRFPSIGALNPIRTGMIPDRLSDPVDQQRGTPFRSLNFSASSANSQRVNTVRYPDWAMLDLFLVPFLPHPVNFDAQSPARFLTSGGATQGRLNINNPRIPHPFEGEAMPPVRTAPLEALFHGLQTSTSYDPQQRPIYQPVDSTALAQAVQTYLTTNGPFLLPGQLAEVPEVDAHTFTAPRGGTHWSADTSRSRNDLLRQVVGATTTQSNTFSIWVVAQTFQKKPGNTDYSQFEDGDIVTGEVRRRYVIERFIEPGADGVPGNSVNPGPDGLVNTADDPIDENHPAFNYPIPYRWRHLLVENLF